MVRSTDSSARSRALRWLALAVALVAALALAACGGDSGGGDSGGDGGSASSSSSSSKPLVIANLEGPLADGGPDWTKGMEIAAREINDAGGVDGRPIEIRTFKKGLTAQESVEAYREAASDDDVLAAWVGGGGGLAIKAQADRVRLPFLASVGRIDLVEPVNPYAFAVSFNGEYATSAVSWAVANRGTRKIGVLHYETDFSEGLTPAIQRRCEELGCEVVSEQRASLDDSVDALIPQLTALKNSGADTYYIESLNPNAAKAARQLGMFDKPVITEQWLTVLAIAQATGKAAETMVFGAHKCRAPEVVARDDETRRWCEEYMAKFRAAYPGEPFALYSIYGNDAVNMFADAARRAMAAHDGDVDRESLREALEQFDGHGLRTSHGLVKSSPENHSLVGTWKQAYVDLTIKADGRSIRYVLAPGADPAGATP